MSIVYLGDFRAEQLFMQESDYANSTYIKEYNAEHGWLDSFAASQLPHWTAENADIVILLGFNDCVYSCVWPNFYNITKIANIYTSNIMQFYAEHPNSRFYMCTVNPVTDDYPFAEYPNGLIPKKELNDKITVFNKAIKENLIININKLNNKISEADTAKTLDDFFIDSYSYLEKTGYTDSTNNYNTIDGVRYNNETSDAIITYIQSCISPVFTKTSFKPRKEAPSISVDDSDGDLADIFWWTDEIGVDESGRLQKYGGYNPFSPPNPERPFDALPGYAAYAWGRFYEINDSVPKFPVDKNAALWYNGVKDAQGSYEDGYTRSFNPTLGAIACWTKTDSNGKLAVVEHISADNSIVTFSWSEDNPNSYNEHFKFVERTNSDGAWGEKKAGYTFLGFISCPLIQHFTSGDKSNLCTKNSYNISLEEALPNAIYIYNYFCNDSRPEEDRWTLNAVAGMLGNMWSESKLSPGVWESPNGSGKKCVIVQADGSQTLTDTGRTYKKGYGLTQWTPTTKYLTWCKAIPSISADNKNINDTGNILPFWDIDSQLKRIEAEIEQSGKSWIEGLSQWIKKPKQSYDGVPFDISFREFTKSTRSPAWLACCFLYCYERPASVGTSKSQESHDKVRKARSEQAEYWYQRLINSGGAIPNGMSYKESFIKNFRVKELQSTEASFSFLVKGSSTCTYTLFKNNNAVKNYTNKELLLNKDVLTEVGIQIFSIKNLEPNTSYNLQITSTDANESSTETLEIDFKTLQKFPDPPGAVSLTKLANDFWNITFTKVPVDCSYEISLFVNGKLFKAKDFSGGTAAGGHLVKKINLKQEFGYDYKITDTIQIGVRTYIKTNDGKVFNSQGYMLSQSLCGLSKPVEIYIKNI